jgi:hypothetical protein
MKRIIDPEEVITKIESKYDDLIGEGFLYNLMNDIEDYIANNIAPYFGELSIVEYDDELDFPYFKFEIGENDKVESILLVYLDVSWERAIGYSWYLEDEISEEALPSEWMKDFEKYVKLLGMKVYHPIS